MIQFVALFFHQRSMPGAIGVVDWIGADRRTEREVRALIDSHPEVECSDRALLEEIHRAHKIQVKQRGLRRNIQRGRGTRGRPRRLPGSRSISDALFLRSQHFSEDMAARMWLFFQTQLPVKTGNGTCLNLLL